MKKHIINLIVTINFFVALFVSLSMPSVSHNIAENYLKTLFVIKTIKEQEKERIKKDILIG